MFLVAALFAHSVACRFSPERNRIILFMLTGTIVGVTLIAALYFYCDTASQIIAGTMVYAFCIVTNPPNNPIIGIVPNAYR